MTGEEKEATSRALLSLLRSLSFLTSPNDMFSFLSNQVVEEFHEDCPDLLRELYEDGFLVEAPGVLCSDCNSLSSSILSVQGTQAPLYCEDSSSMSNDTQPGSSTSTFSRQRSWMDPCQLSQSSFSITVPKGKKKKKSSKRDPAGEGRVKIPSGMFSKQRLTPLEQPPGRCRYLSAEVTADEVKQSSKRRKLSRKNSVLDTPLKKQVKNPTTAKTSRARQRVDITPQKTCSAVVQIKESPVRGGSGRASSFFGSQTQPPATRSFVIKDGFKTPNIPGPTLSKTLCSSTEDIATTRSSPNVSPRHFTPPGDSSSRSNHSFTPPGTPRSGRKFVKKLSYNSPMRALFVTHASVSPKRKPLDSDFIQMKRSPGLDKENEPFFPTFKSLDEPKCSPMKLSDALANTLEPIFNPRHREISEDAQMPTFEGSASQGTLNLQSKGGFLKLLEESNLTNCPGEVRCDSDNESDVSAASSASQYKSILKSPYGPRRRKKRSVSFSLEADVQFSSDNESEGGGNGRFFSLINMVDNSIKSDEMLNVENMFGCEDLITPDTVVEAVKCVSPNTNSFYGYQSPESAKNERTSETHQSSDPSKNEKTIDSSEIHKVSNSTKMTQSSGSPGNPLPSGSPGPSDPQSKPDILEDKGREETWRKRKRSESDCESSPSKDNEWRMF